jgi:hypothetical protein
MIKSLTLAVAIGYAISSSLGCVTAVVWEDAGKTTISSPRVRQIDPAADGQPPRVIVNYSMEDSDREFGRFDRALPLGPDGLPPASYVYRGKRLTLGEIAQDIPTPQKQAILATDLAPCGKQHAAPVAASSGTHMLATTSAAHVLRNWSPTFHSGCDSQIGVVILSPDALRVWPGGRECGGDPDLAGVRVLPGEVVVFVPLSQPRPAGDLARSRLGATLLTPPAVAADAAMVGVGVPLIFILLITGVVPRC